MAVDKCIRFHVWAMVKKIVGHKGQGVTQTVYTHFEIEALLDAINKI